MKREQHDLSARLDDSHWWFVGRRRILSTIVQELLPPDRRSVVVDIGCGAGGNLAAFAARHECIGVDASDDALAHARARFPALLFRQARGPRDVQDVIRRADVIMLNDVLEHVQEDRRFLSEIVDSTTPGTRLLVTVPADMALWTSHDASHGHFRRYTRDELQSLWEGLPVEAQLVSYFNTRLYPVIRVIRTLGRWRNRPFGASNTDLRPPSRPINAMLARLFGGEAARVRRALQGRPSARYRYGVSLIAVLRVVPTSRVVSAASTRAGSFDGSHP